MFNQFLFAVNTTVSHLNWVTVVKLGRTVTFGNTSGSFPNEDYHALVI